MNLKLLFHLACTAIAAAFITFLAATQLKVKALAAAESKHNSELSAALTESNALQQKVEAAQLERDQYKATAAEIHKLRGEVAQLRSENETLRKQVAARVEEQKALAANASASPPASPIPESFPDHSSVGKFAAALRAKARSGQLSPEEMEWLKTIKPELEKLEAHPRDFAAFQAAMIQEVAGITDPEKAEQIRNTIERVYENANRRGLNLQSRPAEDSAWVDQRHQLDRRGTGAVQKLLTDDERAAFDRSFLGIMGVDVGTSVDKSLYPPGFIRDEPVGR